jgi:hypothetical protein
VAVDEHLESGVVDRRKIVEPQSGDMHSEVVDKSFPKTVARGVVHPAGTTS